VRSRLEQAFFGYSLVYDTTERFGVSQLVCIYGASRLLIRMHCAFLGDANMNKGLKIAAVIAVLLLALGGFSFLYASAQTSSSTANNASATDQQIGQAISQQSGVGLRVFANFLNHANQTEVTGKVVSEFQGMLILSTDQGQVRVLLPKTWSYKNQLLNRTELIDNFAATGETITVKVLKGEWVKNNFSLNIMIGYEAINAADAHAYAVLPFNIEASS
jgi:hypothetical protein